MNPSFFLVLLGILMIGVSFVGLNFAESPLAQIWLPRLSEKGVRKQVYKRLGRFPSGFT